MASNGASIQIVGLKRVGELVLVSVRITGWQNGARWRVLDGGRYNNTSLNRTLGIALGLPAGVHQLRAELLLNDKAAAVSASKGILIPRPASGSIRALAAGDIACDPLVHVKRDPDDSRVGNCQDARTAALIGRTRPTVVLPLGDLQYGCPSMAAYNRGYARTWGRYRRISRPVLGNHEFGGDADIGCRSPDAAPYYTFFGQRAGSRGLGYYSYEIGTWHVVALNSECSTVGGCGRYSPQYQWLVRDLAAHPRACTLVYWHQPRWSPVPAAAPDNARLDGFWRAAVVAGVDVVLNGDSHLYARFRPLGAGGLPSASGPRVFIVGTGGRSLVTAAPRARTVSVSQGREFGVLLLDLEKGAYRWQFVPIAGGHFTDYGSATCGRD